MKETHHDRVLEVGRRLSKWTNQECELEFSDGSVVACNPG